MSNSSGPVDYDFTISHNETAIEIGVHHENSIGEPRLRWRTDSGHSGEWGLLYVPDTFLESGISFARPYTDPVESTPELRFGRLGNELVVIDDEPLDGVAVPEETARKIAEQLAHYGRYSDAETIATDPDSFPSRIQDTGFPETSLEWTRVGWDEENHVMWYELADFMELAAEDPPSELESEAATAPRAYQIDDGDLIWRKHILVDLDDLPDLELF